MEDDIFVTIYHQEDNNMIIPRLELIQSLIDKKNFTQYLEIGVSIGTVFFRIICKKKIAVDPEFGFTKFKVLTRTLRLNNFSNLSARYFEKTSDDFFEQNAKDVFKDPLEICLVDGMHEYKYALNDIENSLKYLSKNGVIIIHDCNPREESNACTFAEWKERGFTGEWNGDVWKAIVHLRSTRSDIEVFVADVDQGLGIVTWKPSPTTPALSFSENEISNLKFQDFAANRKQWLNLHPAERLNELFGLDIKFQ